MKLMVLAKKAFACILGMGIVLCVPLAMPVFASDNKYIDQVNTYEIVVSPNEDDTVRLDYKIQWEVIDAPTTDPLSFITVGLPNVNFEILAYDDSIVYKITPSGATLRIDLAQNYYKGDVVEIKFSILQDKLLMVNPKHPYLLAQDEQGEGESLLEGAALEEPNEGKPEGTEPPDTEATDYSEQAVQPLYVFYFTPGWFDEVAVKELRVLWKNSEYITSVTPEQPTTELHEGIEYLVWSDSLSPGEKRTFQLYYLAEAFALDWQSIAIDTSSSGGETDGTTASSDVEVAAIRRRLEEIRHEREQEGYQPTNNRSTSNFSPMTILYVILGIISIPLRFLGGSRSSYRSGSGFRSSGGRSGGGRSSGGRRGGRGCACAGGGRAGCSQKEFYSNDVGAIGKQKKERILW